LERIKPLGGGSIKKRTDLYESNKGLGGESKNWRLQRGNKDKRPLRRIKKELKPFQKRRRESFPKKKGGLRRGAREKTSLKGFRPTGD